MKQSAWTLCIDGATWALRKNSDISVTFSVLMVRDGCGCNSSQDKMNTYCFELYMHCVCTDTHRRMSRVERSHRSCSFNPDMSDAGDLWNENLNTHSLTHTHRQKEATFHVTKVRPWRENNASVLLIHTLTSSGLTSLSVPGSLYLKYRILRKAFLVLILHVLFYFPYGLVCVESMVN